MAVAKWKDVVLAESDTVEEVEGNLYFPPDSLNREYFEESGTTTRCPWKGQASYYNVTVDGEVNEDAAWYYPDPTAAASKIEGYVAFWRGVEVEG